MERRSQIKQWAIFIWFVLVFGYICVRAFTVEPMLDELASYFNYFQTGNIINNQAWVDANNHLLNSFIGWMMYRTFGDHFILFRLLAVLSFPLYFFAMKRLVQQCVSGKWKWFVFIALTSVPWIIEYFSFSRGYGSSLAFFFVGIYFLIRFKAEKRAALFVLLLFFFALGISSNLALLIPSVIAICYALLVHILVWKEISKKIVSLLGLLLFSAFFLFILYHIDKLKSAGALWWGSRDGLWEVTGKSLSRIVFFNESDGIKYLLAGSILTGFVLWVLAQWKKNVRTILLSDSFWLPGLFFACIGSIIFLSEVMLINYPMDRVAMYLVPLFILVIGMLFSGNKLIKWTLFCFIWFPISFILNLNVETSIFSPEDRFSKEFAQVLKEKLPEDKLISVDFVSHLSYAYMMRKSHQKTHIGVEYSEDNENDRGELHVSWIQNYGWDNFKMIYQEPNAGTTLYQRENVWDKVLVFDTLIPLLKSSDKYINLVEFNLENKYVGKRIQAQVESSVHLNYGTLKLKLISQIGSESAVPRWYDQSRFDWYFGHQTNYEFNFPNRPIKLEESDKNYFIYVLNQELRQVKLENTRIRFYLVSE